MNLSKLLTILVFLSLITFSYSQNKTKTEELAEEE